MKRIILSILALVAPAAAQVSGDILYNTKNAGTGSTLRYFTPSTSTDLLSLNGSGLITRLPQSTFAAASHTQAISTITGLQTALDGKLATDGTGSSLTALNATNITSGTLDIARLNWSNGIDGTSQANKVAVYSFGGWLASAPPFQVRNSGTSQTSITVDSLAFIAGSNSTTLGRVAPTDSHVINLPAIGTAGSPATLITTLDTGTVTNAMLAGSIAISKLAITGTPDGTKYLRDDGSWQTVSTGLTIGSTAITGGTSGRILTSGTTVGELTPGTGVTTALAVSIGSAGSMVTNGGALGTPSSGTLTNCTSLPVAGITASTSAALGVGSIELGHASDTTLARVSAGVASVEGATIATLAAANVFSAAQTISQITPGAASGLYLLFGVNNTGGAIIGTGGYMPGLTVGSAGRIGFSSTVAAPSAGQTTFFSCESDGVFQLGADGSAPVNHTIKGADGSGTNIAGAPLTLSTGRSTGSATGPDLIINSSMSGSSGTAASTLQERVRVVGRFRDLTESTATNLVSIALPSGKVTGGTATVTVWAGDGTDCQALTSEIRFGAVNKAGTVTATCAQTDGTTAASAGTLTVTYDATASGNNVLLRANATSSLTQTTLRSRIVITAINGDDTQVVTPQ